GLESCTAEIQASDAFLLDGKRVILFDTPGFDDSNLDDVEVLRKVTSIKKAGSYPNFHMFSELCGSEVMNNVVIVTNMWETVSQEIGERRERQLSITADHFGSAVKAGAKMVRHYDNYESTKNILRLVLPNVPEALRIQKEIADKNLELHQTSAGKVLYKEQEQLIRSHQEEIKQLKQQMIREIEAQRKKSDARIQELQDDLKKAQTSFNDLNRSWKEERPKLEGRIRELEQNSGS
ncbi:13533_t:CDS:2, partial [Acaulospora colombiana]